MRFKLIFVFILYLIVVGIFSCSSSNKTIKSSTSDYEFILTDSSGTDTIALGSIQIDTTKVKLSGKFEIHKSILDFPLYDSLKAIFEGTYDSSKKTIWLNMNPKLADNNIFITASFLNNKLEGDWVYSTMKGIKDKGKFYAEKK